MFSVLTKKNVAAVLALGTLLSVTPVRAVNSTQVGVAAGALAAALYAYEVDNTQKAKGTLTKALDTGSNAVHGVVHSKWTKVAGVAAAVVGAFHYK